VENGETSSGIDSNTAEIRRYADTQIRVVCDGETARQQQDMRRTLRVLRLGRIRTSLKSSLTSDSILICAWKERGGGGQG
jgi:hypothetical protein